MISIIVRLSPKLIKQMAEDIESYKAAQKKEA